MLYYSNYVYFVNIGDDSNNKFGRRDKFQKELAIYRPGSGPLRRSGNSRQEDDDDDDKRFSGFGRDIDSSKKSDFIPNKHFENSNRKKENFPRTGPSKVNGFAADSYSTFNLRRKQQKKTQPFYEPPNEWTNDKRPDRPRVNFVNPDSSKDDDDANWRAHKAPKVVNVPKVIKKVEEKSIPDKISTPTDSVPSVIINARVNTASTQNNSDKASSFGNRKREEKKPLNKAVLSNLLVSYEKLPPRFRKKFCEDNHITVEEVESLLTNGLSPQDDHNKQQSSFQSRSQTLPTRSGKGRSNEPQRQQEQVFYRTSSNQLPLKTEVRRVASSTESNRRSVDFDLPSKNYNSHQNSRTVDNDLRDNDDNVSVNIKQSFESAVLLPSGTIVSFNLVNFFIK